MLDPQIEKTMLELQMPQRPTESTRRNTTKITIKSKSGELPGRLTIIDQALNEYGIVLCPGLAMGLDGDFIKNMEDEILSLGLAKYSLRFNFSGYKKKGFNPDIRGFTFTKSIDDFSAAVETLRTAGAKRVIAICSSTGTQPALLAACSNIEGAKVDYIIARSAVVDCFGSIWELVRDKPGTLEKWRTAGEFDFPIETPKGPASIKMSAAFLSDVEEWRNKLDLSKIAVPVTLVHGERDTVIPLAVVERNIQTINKNLVVLKKIPGQGHDFSENPEVNMEMLIDLYRAFCEINQIEDQFGLIKTLRWGSD